VTASARGRDIRESGPKDDVTVPLLHFRFTPIADIDHHRIDVRFVPIVLKKSANWQFGIGQCNRRIGLDCA
jgi:hypothetical protein